MELSVSHQLFVFVCMVLCGGATGVIFDAFRAHRRCVKSGSGIIAAQDLLLWFAELVIVYYTAFKVNNAQIRGYEAIALIVGAVLYFITLSEYVMKLMCKIITAVIKIFSSVVSPLKKLCTVIAKPFKRLFLFVKTKVMLLGNNTKTSVSELNMRIKTALSVKKHKI